MGIRLSSPYRRRSYEKVPQKSGRWSFFGELSGDLIVQKEVRRQRSTPLSLLVQDLRYAARTLRNSPGFAAVAVLTLALGIGANTAIFSFVDGILLRPLPYPEADRIVRVLEKPPGFPRNGISTLNFLDWQRQNTVFDFMAAQTGASMTLSGTNEPVLLHCGLVSAHYFDIFGIKAALGRTFLPDEDQAGKDHVVLLSYVLWQNRFGGDRSIVNRTILLDNEPYQVVGILPP